MNTSPAVADSRLPPHGAVVEPGVAIAVAVEPRPDPDRHRRLTIEQAFTKLLDLKSRTFLL